MEIDIQKDIQKNSEKKRQKEINRDLNKTSLDQASRSSRVLPSYFNPDEDYLLEKRPVLKEDSSVFKNVELQARELFSQKQDLAAERLLCALHAKGAGSAESLHLLGSIEYNRGDLSKAKAHYKKALSQNPEHLETLSCLALICLDTGEYEEGFFFYRKAHEKLLQNKTDSWAESMASQHLTLGKAYFEKKLWHEALYEFLKAYPRKKHPLIVDVYIVQCFMNLGRKGEAFKKLMDLKRKHPVAISVCLLLGDFYWEVKKYTLAINEWERVLRFDPHNEEVLPRLKKAQDLGRPKKENRVENRGEGFA